MAARRKTPVRDQALEELIEDGADPNHPIVLAAKAVGSCKELARRMGMSPQGITKMKNTRVTAERVLQMERVTGISRHVLRPDIYPIEECPNCGFLIGASVQRVSRASHSDAGRNNRGREAR